MPTMYTKNLTVIEYIVLTKMRTTFATHFIHLYHLTLRLTAHLLIVNTAFILYSNNC